MRWSPRAGADPRDTQRFNARPGDVLNGAPIVVLINAGSASASEIVAGSLQDRERGAVILGTNSFGKGSMQTVIPLRGGRDGALRLTTARYYTPSGRSIQATGLEPDIAVAFRRPREGEVNRFSEANLRNALRHEAEQERREREDIEYPPEDWADGEGLPAASCH